MKKRGSKGQGMVEFAILLPIMAVLIVGVVALFHLFAVMVTMHNAAAEGGRAALVWRPDEVTTCAGVVREAVLRTDPFFDPATDVITTSPNCSNDPWARIPSGSDVEVTITIQWEPIFFGTLGQDLWEPPRSIPLSTGVIVSHQ